jgi:hypothetical protein
MPFIFFHACCLSCPSYPAWFFEALHRVVLYIIPSISCSEMQLLSSASILKLLKLRYCCKPTDKISRWQLRTEYYAHYWKLINLSYAVSKCYRRAWKLIYLFIYHCLLDDAKPLVAQIMVEGWVENELERCRWERLWSSLRQV